MPKNTMLGDIEIVFKLHTRLVEPNCSDIADQIIKKLDFLSTKQVLPTEEHPPEIPRVILNSNDSKWTLVITGERVSLKFMADVLKDNKGINFIKTEFQEKLLELKKYIHEIGYEFRKTGCVARFFIEQKDANNYMSGLIRIPELCDDKSDTQGIQVINNTYKKFDFKVLNIDLLQVLSLKSGVHIPTMETEYLMFLMDMNNFNTRNNFSEDILFSEFLSIFSKELASKISSLIKMNDIIPTTNGYDIPESKKLTNPLSPVSNSNPTDTLAWQTQELVLGLSRIKHDITEAKTEFSKVIEQQKKEIEQQKEEIEQQKKAIEQQQINFITILGLFAALNSFVFGGIRILENGQTILSIVGVVLVLLCCVLLLVGGIGFFTKQEKAAYGISIVSIIVGIMGSILLCIDGFKNPANISNNVDFLHIKTRIENLERINK